MHRDQLIIARASIEYLAQPEFQRNIFENDFLVAEESPTSLMLPSEDYTSIWELSVFATHGGSIFKDEMNIGTERCAAIAASHGFFDYAATFWATHFSECESIALEHLYPG
jgi:hypothetical protein